jgi:hypothetical protein
MITLETPYEKAKSLVRRYYHIVHNFDVAKECAGIAVFEIIEDRTDGELDSAYWQEVRVEVYALGSPHSNNEARADRFNEDLINYNK